MSQSKTLLLASDNDNSTTVITDLVSNLGYTVYHINSCEELNEKGLPKQFSVIVANLQATELLNLSFIKSIKKNEIQGEILFVKNYDIKYITKVLEDHSIEYIINSPIKINKLEKIFNKIESKSKETDGFSSKLNKIGIFDYIKMINIAKKTKVISILPPLEKELGFVYFKDGEIVHCIYKNETGKEAFYKVACLRGGIIKEKQWEEPEEITINIPSEALILNAATYIDENTLIPKDFSKEDRKYKVLIVDDSPITLLIMSKSLMKKDNIEVKTLESAVDAVSLLKTEHFDMIISDIQMPDINGFEFMFWINKNNIKSKLVIMTSNDSSEFEEFALKNGAVRYYNKSDNISKIFDFIEADNISGFSGHIEEITLFDYVQMATMLNKTTILEVVSSINNENGDIYIKNGKIIRAEYNNLEAEEAFYNIFNMVSGVISEKEYTDSESNEIKSTTFSLLMNTAKILENKAKTSLVHF